MSQDLDLDARQAAIHTIVVESRVRQDMGDLDSLMESMKSLRLLNPITVTPKRELIAGGRRLEAATRLGWKNIPVAVVDNVSDATALLMERDENTCRKEMTHSERMDLARRLEALERPKARERVNESIRKAKGAARFEAPSGASNDKPATHYKVSSVIGPAVGLSQRHYERARSIELARESDNPEVVEVANNVVEKLDSGDITYTAAQKEVLAAQRPRKEEAPNVKPTTIGTTKNGGRSAFPPDAEALRRFSTSLHGYAIALDRITKKELDQSVTAEEADALHADLNRDLRSINRVIKQLSERKTP